MTLIVGAGLAGLIAGNLLPDAQIIEAAPERPNGAHKAVLRFRTDAIGKTLGIDFRPVTVNKGIWHEGAFRAPSIELANLYSRKVIGRYADRSIWKMEPSQRFIAPENLYERLVARCKDRIQWNTEFQATPDMLVGDVISTAPMSVMAQRYGYQVSGADMIQFHASPIKVRRWRVKDADVFQTIYFPEHSTNLYRASITKDLLIAEYMNEVDNHADMLRAFGMSTMDAEQLDVTSQRFGKIAPINDGWRRAFIRHLSSQHQIYSLGRFATWRNILLDDVLNDVFVIKRLMEGDSYGAARHSVNQL